jgi:hypothetical protein
LSVKNTGITHPVLVDVVSGEIKRLSWKAGTTDTLELLPIKDSIMAITDEGYFDWPVLPEAPSSLNLSVTNNTVKLNWEVHGSSRTGVVVERSMGEAGGGKESWNRIAKLPSTAADYSDSTPRKGERFAYRVRAINDDGESAYSNIVRAALPTRP